MSSRRRNPVRLRRRRQCAALALLALFLCLPTAARAVARKPDGYVIPASGNTALFQDLFDGDETSDRPVRGIITSAKTESEDARLVTSEAGTPSLRIHGNVNHQPQSSGAFRQDPDVTPRAPQD